MGDFSCLISNYLYNITYNNVHNNKIMTKKQRKRKTANEYREEYASLQQKLEAIDIRISRRLSELVKKFPDAIIAQEGSTMIRAKSLADERYVATLTVMSRINFIAAIEKWNLEQQCIVQTEINFESNENI